MTIEGISTAACKQNAAAAAPSSTPAQKSDGHLDSEEASRRPAAIDGAQAQQSSAEEVEARRRAFVGHVITAGCTVAASVIAFRRGRRMGFKNLFNSISAPKDFVYIGFLYGAGDVSQQLVTQVRRYLL